MARRIAATTLAAAIIYSGCTTIPNSLSPQARAQHAPDQSESATGIDSGPQPDWVSGESSEYPRLHYLTSRAQGDTPEQARRQALANLSAYFVVDSGAVGMSVQQAAAAGYEPRNNMDQSAPTVASPEADRILEKIEVVAQWFDSGSNRYHALAAVPRNTAKGYLQDQIEALDEKTREYMKQARNNPDPFVQAGKLAMAWRSQQIRAKMQDSMKRADLTGRGIEPQFNLSSMKQDAEELLTTLRIQPAGLEGEENAERVAQLLSGGLLTQDLKPAIENADYIMRGTLDAAVIGERNGWALGHGKLKLVLLDKPTGQVLGSTEWEVDVPGLDENAAIRRVYEKTEYMLKVGMRDVLMEMAMQQSSSGEH